MQVFYNLQAITEIKLLTICKYLKHKEKQFMERHIWNGEKVMGYYDENAITGIATISFTNILIENELSDAENTNAKKASGDM